MALTYDGTAGITFNDGSQINTASQLGMRNRIINGNMAIDQRNSGAQITANDVSYPVDRFRFNNSQSSKLVAQQMNSANTSASNYESGSAPIGFTNSLKITSSSAYSISSSDYFAICQFIEGYNIADFNWGTTNASTVTLSFWVKSSLTGLFGGTILNSAANRAYPFTYTINSANTWQYITITIPGETTGTWLRDNGQGLLLFLGLGVGSSGSGTPGSWASGSVYRSATGATSLVGTNAATFYITGVQLEKASAATPFDYRHYGTELALCQRYYFRITGSTARIGIGQCFSTTAAVINFNFPVPMRVAPSALEQDGTAGDYYVCLASGSGQACSAVPTFNTASTLLGAIVATASSLTAGNATIFQFLSTSVYLGWSAEL